MTFGALPPELLSRRRRDNITGTPEADTLVVEPLAKSRRDLITEEIRYGVVVIEPSLDLDSIESPEFETQSWESWDAWWDDHVIRMGIPTIVDSTEDTKVDLLVYQEAESFNYIPGFTNPPVRSYTIIEDFDPVEDEIFVGENRVGITPLPKNDIPMLTDDVQPAFWCDNMCFW